MTSNVSKSVFTFSATMIADASAHARRAYPEESCGLIVDGRYRACKNIAADPEHDFVLDPKDQAKWMIQGKIEAVVHSHPRGVLHPTRSDMESQIASDLPWMIVPLDAEFFGKPIIWGGNTEIPNIIGREFVHGVTDCFTLIRDCYRQGRDVLAAQGIDWPFTPIEFADIARDFEWENLGENLYMENFAKWGFEPVPFSSVRPGDVFLINVNHPTLNHGGLLLSNNLLLQHFPRRLSRREPAGIWARNASVWLRHKEAAAHAA